METTQGTEIYCNGETRLVRSTTIAELLSELELTDKKVAVEKNREIVPRASYARTPVAAGDQIEIVHFVGGG